MTALDLADPAVVADPYPAFAAARGRTPVGRHERLGLGVALSHQGCR